MKVHWFYLLCSAFVDGDTFTLDPEKVSCPHCREQMTGKESVGRSGKGWYEESLPDYARAMTEA